MNKNWEKYLDPSVNPLRADLTSVDNFPRASSLRNLLRSRRKETRKSFPQFSNGTEQFRNCFWPPMETVRLPGTIWQSKSIIASNWKGFSLPWWWERTIDTVRPCRKITVCSSGFARCNKTVVVESIKDSAVENTDARRMSARNGEERGGARGKTRRPISANSFYVLWNPRVPSAENIFLRFAREATE